MSRNQYQIAVLPGDGVGPEVTRGALAVLLQVADTLDIAIEINERPVGGASYEEFGVALTDDTLALCRSADAILFGATGGPQWDHLTGPQRPGSSLLRLRRELGLCVNLRPVRAYPALAQISPLRSDVAAGTDMIIVRELSGGLYFGDSGRDGAGPDERAFDTLTYTRAEISRVVDFAFSLAEQRRGRLTSVDKANVLRSGRLWRDVVNELASQRPNVALNHQLVDSFCFRVLAAPTDYDVVVTENLMGDIISDEVALVCGSLGLMPSASLNPAGGPGLYEPVHGSAPDIAGRDIANPIGAILSVALLFEHSLQRSDAAELIRTAVDRVIADGPRTRDVGGAAQTSEVAGAVLAALPQPALVGTAS
jgi:3-isopropylmalate dehydrogenase